MAKQSKKNGGGNVAVEGLSIAQITEMLEARKTELTNLQTRLSEIDAERSQITTRISALGEPTKGRRGRPRKVNGRKPSVAGVAAAPRAGTMAAAIRKVLSSKPDGMRVKDIEAALKAGDNPSGAKNLYSVVATTLRKGPFVTVSRGVYANAEVQVAAAAV